MNILLTILGYFPEKVHAIWVIANKQQAVFLKYLKFI